MSEMQQPLPTIPSSPFRLDVPLHSLLQQPPEKPSSKYAKQPETLPTPVFPQHPELMHDLDAEDIAAHDHVLQTGKRYWPASRIFQTMRGWMFPYFKSRVLPGDFQPIIAYLFTEWKCNLDCHYCWSYDNRVKGMTEDTARHAIDWLATTPARVLAPTGGEPLLRPDFVHKVMYYAAKISGFTLRPMRGCSARKSPTLSPMRESPQLILPSMQLKRSLDCQRLSNTCARTST